MSKISKFTFISIIFIRYYKKENGGKHRAINYALDKAKGELFFTVDSDDYLTNNALEKINKWENKLYKSKKFAGIVANLGTDEHKTINNFFALVIPVYNKFLVSSIGAACGKHIITTSNSLPCDLCIVIE